MGFSDDDRILIENLYIFKGYRAKKLITEFPDKGSGSHRLNKLLRKLRDTGTTARRSDSGRPRSAWIDDNINAVNDLVLSQEDVPKTHWSTRQIARETSIHHSSVYHIVRKDLRLKCLKKCRSQELTAANRDARLTRAKKLLCLYPQSAVDFIFFSDEKIFIIAPPVNLQNDRVYVPQSSKKRDVAADRLPVHVQRSASRWWCRLPCPSSGAQSWFSSSLGLRSVAPITEMSCWWNTCCQQYDRSLEITLSSSRIARRRIVLATPSTFCVAQRRSSSPQTCGRQTAQTSTR